MKQDKGVERRGRGEEKGARAANVVARAVAGDRRGARRAEGLQAEEPSGFTVGLWQGAVHAYPTIAPRLLLQRQLTLIKNYENAAPCGPHLVLLWTLSVACSPLLARRTAVDLAHHLLCFEVGRLHGREAVGGRKWGCEMGRLEFSCTPAGEISRRTKAYLSSILRP